MVQKLATNLLIVWFMDLMFPEVHWINWLIASVLLVFCLLLDSLMYMDQNRSKE